MIDFPASPTIGQTFIDPTTNLEWMWDGTKWIASGLANAPFQPLFGVTDGSNAAAGQIGEVIAANVTTPVALSSGVTATVGSISLTPGDWDVSGEVWFVGAASLLVAGIYPTNVFTATSALNASRNQLTAAITGGNTIMPLRPCRASLATTTTYFLLSQMAFASGSPTAAGNIIARRAR
jgi:hypothetical protein